MTDLRFRSVKFVAGSAEAIEQGLLGFISCRINEILGADGLALRRTLEGRPALSFPSHRDRKGRKRSILYPVDDESRMEIEFQIFRELGLL